MPTCRTQTRHTRVRARTTKGILTQKVHSEQRLVTGYPKAASWHKAAIHVDCLAEQLSSRTQTLTQRNLYRSRRVVGAGASASQHPSVAFS